MRARDLFVKNVILAVQNLGVINGLGINAAVGNGTVGGSKLQVGNTAGTQRKRTDDVRIRVGIGIVDIPQGGEAEFDRHVEILADAHGNIGSGCDNIHGAGNALPHRGESVEFSAPPV